MLLDRFLYKVSERYYDWRWGIRTYSYVTATELGYGKDFLEYAPVPYLVLHRMFKELPDDVRKGSIIDFGSGLGRVLVAAHRNGFHKPTGVEYSDDLCHHAGTCAQCGAARACSAHHRPARLRAAHARRHPAHPAG